MALASQIKASAQDDKMATAMVRKLFSIFEPGQLEKEQIKSDQEDEELRKLVKRNFSINLAHSTPTLSVSQDKENK